MRKLTLLALGVAALGFAGAGDSARSSRQAERKPTPPVVNSIGMKLVGIPPGEFLMGSPDTAADALPDEKPRHRVRITRGFYMGVHEVTQGEYERVLGTNPSFFSPGGPGKEKVAGLDARRLPAEQVRWADAVEFCRRLSALPAEQKAGRFYRLPTEAEWEYACRAGTKTAFAFGDSLSSRQANFNGHHPHGGAARGPFLARTTVVGSYPPNAFGLYDLHGNVWEWCSDWYGAEYYKHSPVDDPPGPASGSMRVIRGGEWYADGRDCRSAFRYAEIPTGLFYVMGFRVVMTYGPSGPDLSKGTPRKAGPPRAAGGVLVPAHSAGEDWPRWRGPRGDGTWRGPELPAQWPGGGLKTAWRQPVGGGYSGVAASRGRVYTQDYRPGPAAPAGRAAATTGRERVLCHDARTGKLLWSHAYPVSYRGLSYANGPRATPTVHGKRLFALGAVGHLHCLDAATGVVLWSRDLARDPKARLPGWGFAASPVVFEDLLILHAGAEPDGCLVALTLQTGKEVWRSLPDPAGYATPLLLEHEGKPQLVCWTPTHVRGVEPRTGRRLWAVPFEVTYGTAIATPIFQEGTVLVSGYYEGSKAIRLGPSPPGAEVVWQDRRNLRALMSQPLARQGHAYLLDRRYGLTCLELKTGKKVWDDGHRSTPKGRNPQATLVWLGETGRALILNSDGELILASLTPAGYQEHGRAGIIGPTWAHPAYAGDCVYARDDSELVCVLLR
jgi:formylglycine-generating enzyme required for sulfatase activity/outer membrane protein assembly factor BamB